MRYLGVIWAAISIIATSCTTLEREEVVTAAASDCKVGIYGTSENFLTITNWDEERLQYSFDNGQLGFVGEDAVIGCSEQSAVLSDGRIWSRRPIKVTDTKFQSKNAVLAGQLLEPAGANSDTTLVIYAHGSEERGWIEAFRDPYQMVGRGLSVFVYDKRGTGQSTGTYSQNFPELSADLVAASKQAKRLAGDNYGRFGLFGLSQGGWIAPMAATRAEADFIGIGYGLLVDILEEDASQVQLELTEAGYDQEILDAGKEITDVTARLAVSNYQDGLQELADLQEKYGDEVWFQNLRGGFSGVLLNMTTQELSENGIPMFDRLNIDWSIKPMDVLREVDVPQLWILAGEDREAPIDQTIERLNILRTEGKMIDLYVFPDTDHGMREFDQAEDGTRTYNEVTEGFYDLMADWATGRDGGPYGTSEEQ